MSSSTSTLFTPLQFTGISKYSSDFQSILTRAVSIAQLPIQQLSNQKLSLQSEATDLSSLGGAVSALGSSLKALGTLGAGSSLSATSSNNAVVTATNTGATSATSYSITSVTSIASTASETSIRSYAASAAVSSTGTMELDYGGKTYPIVLAAGKNNLIGLQTAINSLNAGVAASILTTSTGNYLSLAAGSPGATTLKLIDDPAGAASNIVTATNQGKNTNFNLNGIAISEAGTTVNDVIPGLTLKFAGTTAPSETVTIGLATDRSQMASALQTLATSYNALATQETTQISGTSGSLSGNNIIYQIRAAMSSIVNYQGSGSMGNLANLGIEMSTNGQMSFNASNFAALSDGQITSGLQLLGSSTTGIGGLQQAFTGIADPTSGTIAQQESQWKTTTQKLTDQIATKSNQVLAMEQTLNHQLQAADARAALLASQQSILTASIASMNFTSYGTNTSTASG